MAQNLREICTKVEKAVHFLSIPVENQAILPPLPIPGKSKGSAVKKNILHKEIGVGKKYKPQNVAPK